MQFFFVCLLNVKLTKGWTSIFCFLEKIIIELMHLSKKMSFNISSHTYSRRPKFTFAYVRTKRIVFKLLNLILSLIEVFDIINKLGTMRELVGRQVFDRMTFRYYF